jgi:hypothetical protein
MRFSRQIIEAKNALSCSQMGMQTRPQFRGDVWAATASFAGGAALSELICRTASIGTATQEHMSNSCQFDRRLAHSLLVSLVSTSPRFGVLVGDTSFASNLASDECVPAIWSFAWSFGDLRAAPSDLKERI